MANELRLAFLEEEESGAVVGNDDFIGHVGVDDCEHALEALGGRTPSDLISGTRSILGPADAQGVEAIIESARGGKEAAVTPRAGVRVLAVPREPGMAVVLIASQESPVAESVQAKAAAADLAG